MLTGLSAVDIAGNIGPLSSQVSKTTAASTTSTDKTPPAQVTGLVVSTISSTPAQSGLDPSHCD